MILLQYSFILGQGSLANLALKPQQPKRDLFQSSWETAMDPAQYLYSGFNVVADKVHHQKMDICFF